MQTEASVEIDRPIEDVFDFTNDHVAEWSTTVVEEKIIEETSERVGTKFLCITESRGKRMDFQGVVTRWERPHASAIELIGDSFDIHATYLFESLPAGTRVTQQAVISPKGFVKVIFFLFGWAMSKSSCNEAQQELNNLKNTLENQE